MWLNVRACVRQVLCLGILWVVGGLPHVLLGANPLNGLRIEIIAAPNFIVDSNVESPSTYAPRSAYLGATFYNNGTNDLTDTFAYIGNYASNSPGVYPCRTHTNLTGTFSLTHQGGATGIQDATRYLGTIKPGESVTVFWLVTYPVVDAAGKAVFGSSSDISDDLWLNYDIWMKASRVAQLRVDWGQPLKD